MQKHLLPVFLTAVLAIALGSAMPARAQVGPDAGLTLQPVTVAPSGACANTALRLYTPSGLIYTCQSGNWATSAAGGTCAALAGDVTGSCGATVVSLVGGSTSTDVGTATVLANAATTANTASTIVRRDASGNFIAGTITATILTFSTGVTVTGSSGGFTVKPAGNTGASVNLTPSGSGQIAILHLNNSSDGSNNAQFIAQMSGPTMTLAAGTTTGSGTKMATLNFGEAASAGSGLNIINFTFNAVAMGSITKAGLFTAANFVASGLSTGVGHYDSGGALTSSPVVLTSEVSGLLPNANLANTAITVNGTTCTLGSTCTPIGNNAITALTSDVTATGPGSVAATVNAVGGSTAANVHTAELAANAATSANTVSTIVKRDSSGNFTAGAISGSSFVYSATGGWILTGLPATAGNALLQPSISGRGGEFNIAPSGAAVNARMVMRNSSDLTNYQYLTTQATGSDANVLIASSGTPATAITDLNIGEAGTASSLARVNWQFAGVTKAILTPTRWTVPAETVSGLTTGIGHYDSGGALTSSPVVLTSEVSGLLPNANLANPAITVNGTTCTLGSTCTPSGSGAITALTSDVTASGPGSAAATVNSVGGSLAASVNTATVAANAATSANTASTIVKRDGSGNFTAGTITAAVTGTASGNEVPLTFNTGLLRTSNTVTATANVRTRAIGVTFDNGGTALAAPLVKYVTVPFACTISAWNIVVDTGTATVDIWKIATGTAHPTVANTITASALPAISTGTAIHSTTLTSWTTTATANDIWGFNMSVVGGNATQVNIIVECDQ